MKQRRIPVLVLMSGFVLSCAFCVWAWLCAIDLLFFGIAALPAFFLQMLIERGGAQWRWLLTTHVIILLGALGIGGLIFVLGENWEPILGMLLAIVAASALLGCGLEWLIHREKKGRA